MSSIQTRSAFARFDSSFHGPSGDDRGARRSRLERRIGDAHVDDLLSRTAPGLESRSDAFQEAQRRAGIREWELREALRAGRVETDWSGRTIVRDRVLGLRIELDPTGRIGLDVVRIDPAA